MTQRLYYTDAYQREFDARVVERGPDNRRIYLDATAFYPTSGGQSHDLGTLGGVGVIDVVDEGERIAHVLDAPLPDDASVHGNVDWPRRIDHMQQHTGQHLLSAIFHDRFGYATESVHFSPESSTVDLSTESISLARLIEAERRANVMIAENRMVTVSFEDAASASGLRKATDREGTLRVVTIQGLDRSACGGTHVAATGAIGSIVLRRVEHVRGNTRVEFLCGGRVVTRARADFEALNTLATSLSASIDDVSALVLGHAERLRESEQARRRLERELANLRARELYSSCQPTPSGRRYIVLRDHPGGLDELKLFAQALIEHPGAVVAGSVAGQPSILIATAPDSGIDAGKSLKEALSRVGGRGGGAPRMAQGGVPVSRHDELFAILSASFGPGAA